MRKVIRLTITVLSFTTLSLFQSCGPISDRHRCCDTPTAPSDSAFTNYIADFEYYYGKDTSTRPIYFGDLPRNQAGVCHYFRVLSGPILWGYIEVDREYWQVLSEYQKINLIFHELGHCVLGREHTPSNSVTVCPISMMDDTVTDTQCLEDNFQAYLEEMFPNFKWE